MHRVHRGGGLSVYFEIIECFVSHRQILEMFTNAIEFSLKGVGG